MIPCLIPATPWTRWCTLVVFGKFNQIWHFSIVMKYQWREWLLEWDEKIPGWDVPFFPLADFLLISKGFVRKYSLPLQISLIYTRLSGQRATMTQSIKKGKERIIMDQASIYQPLKQQCGFINARDVTRDDFVKAVLKSIESPYVAQTYDSVLNGAISNYIRSSKTLFPRRLCAYRFGKLSTERKLKEILQFNYDYITCHLWLHYLPWGESIGFLHFEINEFHHTSHKFFTRPNLSRALLGPYTCKSNVKS